jgi:CRISPR system Cascade subunit CasE
VDSGFLFRIDPHTGGQVVIIVQSALKPDWDYAFHNAGYLLAAAPEVKELDPRFAKGDRFQFRLVANPTKRIRKESKDDKGTPIKEKWIGKRVPVPADQLKEWLSRRAEAAGFSIEEAITVQPGYIYMNNPQDGKARLFSARYDGVLTVTDPDSFQKALAAGIGPAKAFGFGLLSLAKVG